MNGQLHFGYPWWLDYGHLAALGVVAVFLLLGYARKWPRVAMLPLGAVAIWAAAGFVVARFVMDVNGRAAMPTANFVRSGAGRVLDMGAGTGRSSIMVLEARAQTTLVALDQFGESYVEHFGASVTPQQKLLSNLQAAGVAQRATIQAGDMRQLPFEAGAFDAIVSAYAVDHLNRKGIGEALGEAARVLKPGGEFLLMVINKDGWLKFTFGPLLLHSGTRGAEWWTERLQEAGFQAVEHGTQPASLYLVARKR